MSDDNVKQLQEEDASVGKAEPAESTEPSPMKKQPEKKQKLTPQQQRQAEEFQRRLAKVNQDADRMYRQMQDRFMDYFMASDDPEGAGVQHKIKQLSSQWKIYCASKNLRPETFTAIQNYCDKIVQEFKTGMA